MENYSFAIDPSDPFTGVGLTLLLIVGAFYAYRAITRHH